MDEKAEGIARIRALADSLERNEKISLAIAWIGNDALICSMDFGHPIMLDAIATHMMRIRVQTGAIKSGTRQ